MSTLPQVLKSRIAFRCEDWLSEAVRIAAVKRRSSLQRVCTEALIVHLGLTRPAKAKRTRAATEEASHA
jgi:hypothetical protein